MVTLDDIKKELKALGVKDEQFNEEGYTSRELADSWGWSVECVLKLLQKCQAYGLIRVVKRRYTNLTGAVTRKPAYVFTLEPSKPKKARKQPNART